MVVTGYSNTFTSFRNETQALYRAGLHEEALAKLQLINRFQWLNRIDAFDVAEAMWSDAAYVAEEIVEHWLFLTSF